MLAISSMTFADTNIDDSPELFIPLEVAGGLVIVGGATVVGAIGVSAMMSASRLAPKGLVPLAVGAITIGATAAITGLALGGIGGLSKILDQ